MTVVVPKMMENYKPECDYIESSLPDLIG